MTEEQRILKRRIVDVIGNYEINNAGFLASRIHSH